MNKVNEERSLNSLESGMEVPVQYCKTETHNLYEGDLQMSQNQKIRYLHE